MIVEILPDMATRLVVVLCVVDICLSSTLNLTRPEQLGAIAKLSPTLLSDPAQGRRQKATSSQCKLFRVTSRRILRTTSVTMKRWIYQDDLVTWHRVYFLWYVIAFLVAMWTVPSPEPAWGVVMHFRPDRSDCSIARVETREHRGNLREPQL
jgi:hypothetical protein